LKLKIDENLPVDCAVILRDAGFEADTVFDERLVGADGVAAQRQGDHRYRRIAFAAQEHAKCEAKVLQHH
jgi:hypothetical protein